VTHPSAQVPAAPAREILKPEIVSGPGAARPASPVEQVVKAVAPLRRLADGTHNIVLELHPAELGAVRVELSLDRGIIHLGLRADTEGTGQLLRAALPELRSQLDAAGLTSGRVSVDNGHAGQAGQRGDGQPAWRTDPDQARRRPLADDAELVEELVPSAYSTSDYGHVDVRL
jgi:flagellar hook-length control protein FliK